MSATKTKKTTKTHAAKSTRKATKKSLASIQKNVDTIDGADGKKTKKPKRESKPKKVSAIDAAAQLLAETKQPMNTREMITAMADKKLWSSPGGKTPHATLYRAILREINEKGKEARFTKTERGKFAASGV